MPDDDITGEPMTSWKDVLAHGLIIAIMVLTVICVGGAVVDSVSDSDQQFRANLHACGDCKANETVNATACKACGEFFSKMVSESLI